MIVSHDRAFLDNVTNRTIEINFGKIYDYKANYTEFVKLRQERIQLQQAESANQQKQIDDIKTLFYWGFGILITFYIFMLGYMIWDRRTAMQPALEKSIEAEAKSTNLIRALREYAKKHADLAEILRSHGIL